jgi:hypothetical protein
MGFGDPASARHPDHDVQLNKRGLSDRGREQDMQRKMFKMLVIGACLCASLIGASSASATWSTNGVVNFTATTGNTQLMASSGAALVCTGANSGTGTLAALTRSTSTTLASVTPVFNGCRVAGVTFTVSCTSANLVGATWTSAGSSPDWELAQTIGSLSGINCTLNVPNCVTTVTGSVNGTYNNPSGSGRIAGRLTVIAGATQNLRLSNSNSATCVSLRIGNGDTGQYTDDRRANAIYNVTVPAPPAYLSQPRVWQP